MVPLSLEVTTFYCTRNTAFQRYLEKHNLNKQNHSGLRGTIALLLPSGEICFLVTASNTARYIRMLQIQPKLHCIYKLDPLHDGCPRLHYQITRAEKTPQTE